MTAPRRTPSLREIAANPPANVAVLPGASPRQVRQRWNAERRDAAEAIRAEHAERFSYRPPHARAVEPIARAVFNYGDSAEALLIVATLARLSREERLAVVEQLAQIDTEGGQRAHLIAKTTVLNFGEAVDLRRAVARLRGDAG